MGVGEDVAADTTYACRESIVVVRCQAVGAEAVLHLDAADVHWSARVDASQQEQTAQLKVQWDAVA